MAILTPAVDWLARREALTPTRPALVDAASGRAVTFRDWNRGANRTARLLAACGVARGDRVAVLSANRTEYLDVWFACGKLGAILQNLSWRLTAHELAGLVADGAPSVLVYDGDRAGTVAAIRAHAPSVRRFVALDPALRAHPGDLAMADREALPDDPPPPPGLDMGDPWVICYTGGTTGLPKGAVLTHGNIAWNSVNTVMSWGLRPGDVTVLNAPLFHTGGLNVFTAPLVHVGGTSVVCRGFDPDEVFDLVRDAGLTLLFGVPTMFIALQEHPRWADADLSRLRLVLSGGAPCPPPVFARFHERGVPFRTGYGLTEAGPNTFWLPDEDVWQKPGSVGVPLFHVDVRVVDPAGRDCGPDEPGELLVRGPHVFAGYWNRPEATAEVLVDGWLRTGDVAVRDADGHHRIVDRIKDVIISGGENVYPAEVEAVLAAHPGVAEVAVVGVPDERWGQVGVAVAVPRAGAALDEDEVLAFCRERLAGFKVPRRLVTADALPRTAAGKTDRRALAAGLP